MRQNIGVPSIPIQQPLLATTTQGPGAVKVFFQCWGKGSQPPPPPVFRCQAPGENLPGEVEQISRASRLRL
jgi:hypothetical protein